MAEYVTEEAPEHKRDTLGLLAGVAFVIVGLSYLIGGKNVVADHWNVFVPVVLVLLGVAGLAGAAPSLRLPRRQSSGQPDPETTEVIEEPELPAE